MISFIKKYPIESLGLYFGFIFFLLAIVSTLLYKGESNIIIPPFIALIVILSLLISFIFIYKNTIGIGIQGWRLWSEIFIMLAALLASLSDGFWISLTIASIIIIIGRIQDKELKWNLPIIHLWILLLIICIMSSIFAIESSFISIGATVGILLYMMFFIATYNQDFIKERGIDFLYRIGLLLSFSIITTVCFSLWHLFYLNADIYLLIFEFQQYTGYRDSLGMASIYGEWPTHSSAFLCLVFWTLIGIRFFNNKIKNKYYRIIFDLGILFSLIGILATLSRNAFLFLIISIGVSVILLLRTKSFKKFIIPVFGLGLVLMGILYFYLRTFSKWTDLLTNPLKQGTIAERINQYKFGIEQFIHLDNQWTGIGLMNFGLLYKKVLNNPNLSDYLHQLPLSLLLEIGYLGLISFTVLILMILYRIISNFKRNPSNPIFVIIFFSWLGMGMFDNWLYFMWSSSLFMILIAIGSCPKNTTEYPRKIK